MNRYFHSLLIFLVNTSHVVFPTADAIGQVPEAVPLETTGKPKKGNKARGASKVASVGKETLGAGQGATQRQEWQPSVSFEHPGPADLRQFIEDSSVVPLKNVHILHILGDLFGKGTALEGQVAEPFLDYHQKLLTRRQDVLRASASQKDPNLEAELQLVTGLLRKIPKAKELSGLLKHADPLQSQEILKRELDHLAPGDSLFFSSGWVGHAIVVELTKQTDNHVTLTVINTGDGLEYHPSYVQGFERVVIPFLAFEDITVDKLTHPFFLAALVQLQDNTLEITPGYFYEVALGFLNGSPSTRKPRPSDLLHAQRSGTCSYASLAAYYIYRGQIASDSDTLEQINPGRRLVLFIQLKALHDAIIGRNRYLATDRASLTLVEKSFVHFATSAKLELKDGNLSAEEALYISEMMKWLKGELESIKATKEEPVPEQVEAKENGAEKYVQEVVNHIKHSEAPEARTDWLSYLRYKKRGALFIPHISLWLQQSNQQASVDRFQELASLLKASNDQEQAREVLSVIEEFSKALPLDPQHTFWRNVHSGSVSGINQTLVEIAKEAIRARVILSIQNGRPEPIAVQDYLALVKLLAVAENLVRHFEPELGNTLPPLRPTWLSAVLDRGSEGSFDSPLFDPQWEDNLREMVRSWSGAGFYDFFNFAVLPAGYPNPEAYYPIYRTKLIQEQVERKNYDFTFSHYQPIPVYMQWARDWIAKTQGKAVDPEYLAVIELTDKDPRRRGYIPSSFFSLRDLSFYCDYLVTHSFDPEMTIEDKSWEAYPYYDFSKGVEFEAEDYQFDGDSEEPLHPNAEGKPTHWRVKYNVFDRNTLQQVERLSSERRKLILDRYNAIAGISDAPLDTVGNRKEGKNPSISGVFQPHLSVDEWSLDEALRLHRTSSSEGLIAKEAYEVQWEEYDPRYSKPLDSFVSHTLSDSEIQQLIKQLSIPDLQPLEVLNTYIAQPQLLEAFSHQQIFKRLLFQGGALLKMLEKDSDRSAQFVSQASTFFSDEFRRVSKVGRTKMALFYAEMALLLRHYVSDYQRTKPHLFPQKFGPIFLDVRKEMRVLAGSKLTVEEDRIMAGYLLARTYLLDSTPLNSDTATELLTSVIAAKIGNGEYFKQISSADQALKGILHAKRNELKNLLSGPQASLILNRILETFAPGVKVEWQLKPSNDRSQSFAHPLYLGIGNKNVLLDVLEGKFFCDSAIIITPPNIRTLIESRLGLSRKQTMSMYAKSIAPNVFEVEWSEGSTLTVSDLKSGPTFYWKRESDIYRLQDKGLFDYPLLDEKYHIWSRETSPSAVSVKAATPSLLERFAEGVRKLFAANPSEFNSLASSSARTDDASSQLLLVNQKTSHIDLIADFEKGKLTIRPFDDEKRAKKETLLPARQHQEVPQFLFRLDMPDYTYLWRDEATHLPTRVEYPRLGLEFHTKLRGDEVKWVSTSFPGYQLAEQQQVPSFQAGETYLVLEQTKNPSKRLIVAAVIPLKEVKTSLDPLVAVNLATHSGVDNPISWVALELTDKGEVRPKSDLERYYYSLILLWNHHYEQAADLLRKGRPPHLLPKEQDSVALAVLTQLAHLGELNKDADPRARAVHLQAYYLLLRNFTDIPEWTEGNSPLTMTQMKGLAPVYRQYLGDTSWAGADLLLPEEELFIAQTLLSGGEELQLIQRVRTLQAILSAAKAMSGDASLTLFDSGTPIRTHGLSETGFKPKDLEILQSALLSGRSQNTPGGLFGKRVISGNFVDLYRIAQSSQSPERDAALRRGIEIVTRVKLPSAVSGVTLDDYWRKALLFAESHVRFETGDQASLVKLLWAVTEEPEIFPTAEDLLKSHKDDLKGIYNQAVAIFESKVPLDAAKTLRSAFELSTDKLSIATRTPLTSKALDEICAAPIVGDDMALEGNAGNYIRVSKLNSEQQQAVRESINELSNVFGDYTADPLLDASWKDSRKNLDKFKEDLIATQEHFEVISLEALKALQKSMTARFEQVMLFIASEEAEVLSLAYTSHEEPQRLAYDTLEELGEARRQLTLDEMARLYATQDVALLQERNSALTADQAIELYRRVGDWMSHRVYAARFQRALDLMQSYLVAQEQRALPQELQVILAGLYGELTATRTYDVLAHPAYLSFEYLMGMMLRPQQKATLDTLQIQDGKIHDTRQLGAVIELIMSAGKTSVLLPLLGQLIADGERLALVVMPESLLPTMSEQLLGTMTSSFGTGVEVLEVNRYKGGLNSRVIHGILQRLQRAKEGRHVVAMSNSSIQSLYLSFLIKLKQYQQLMSSGSDSAEAKDVESVITTYQEIFRLLKKDATVVIDEVDLIMDVYKSHHFATSEPTNVHPHTVEATAGLYELLLQLSDGIHLPFRPVVGGAPFTPETYREVLKPAILDAIFSGQFLPDNDWFQSFLQAVVRDDRGTLEKSWLKPGRTISKPAQEMLFSYLTNAHDPQTEAFIKSIQSTQIKNILAVLSEQLNTVFPLTAKKQLHVHYGANPEAGAKKASRCWAIPYQLGRPLRGSEFGTELEVLNYTTQMYLEEGITKQLVEQEIARLKAHQAHPSTASSAADEFDNLFGEMGLPLLSIEESDFDLLTESVNESKDKVLRLTKRHALSTVRSYTSQMSTNAQLYGMLFKRVHGFTGTLWNKDTFPDIFEIAPASDTRERTLNLLWTTSPHDVAIISEEPTMGADPTELIKALFQNTENPESLIDAGALFRGFSNERVAEKLLNFEPWQDSQIKGIQFYNAQDELMVLKKGDERAIPFASSRLKKEQVIAYWDQAHTTGSDLKLGVNMRAVTTVNKHTITRDLLQSVWRLRGLGKGQTVRFALIESDAKIMSDALQQVGLSGEQMSTLASLLRYLELNQVLKQADSNQRAVKQKLKAVVTKEVVEELVGTGSSPADAAQLYGEIHELLEEVSTKEPYQRYGHRWNLEETSTVLRNLQRKLQNQLAESSIHAGAAIGREMNALIQRMLPVLPAQMRLQDAYEKEIAVELEAEQEQEAEQDQEQEQQASRQGENEGIGSWFQQPWPASNEAQKILSSTLKQAANGEASPGLDVTPDFFYPIRNALYLSRGDRKIHDLFDHKLLVTKNLYPASGRSAFGYHQPSVSHLLVVQDPDSQAINIVMHTHFDVDQAEKMLLEQKRIGGEGLRLALYAMDSEVTLDGAYRIDQAVYTSEEFLRLKSQAKFYRGDVTYSRDEKRQLEKWLRDSKNPQGLRDLFMRRILAYKPISRNMFEGSVIDHLFKQIFEPDSM